MIARAATIAALIAGAALPAGAQTAISTAGDVGSAALRGGYPAGGGAAALPTLPNTAGTPATGTTNTSTTTGGAGSSSGASGSGGRGGGSTSSGAAQGGSPGGGGHWVLCPASGSSALEPLLTGTDLSCAPH